MKLTTLPLMAFSLVFGAIASADTPGGGDVDRGNPEVANALRNPIALGPAAAAFREALHLEEVARDFEAAGAAYTTIARKHCARNDGEADGVAALALFRLAEIRRKQGRDKEARRHYEEVAGEFADWEPMASLSRQQLDLDPSDFLPLITTIKPGHRLADNIERRIWQVRTRVCDDFFVLVTFAVEPDEKSKFENLPEKREIQSLHYCPDGPLSGLLSFTKVEDGVAGKGRSPGDAVPGTLATHFTGFGHRYRMPAGLRENAVTSMADTGWVGLRNSSYDAKVVVNFGDDLGTDLAVVKVSFTLVTVPEAKARALVESRSIPFPETADEAWSLTLPPVPAEFQKMHPQR